MMAPRIATALIDLDNTLHDYNRASAIARRRLTEAIAEATGLPAENVLEMYQRALADTAGIALNGAESRRLRLTRLSDILQKDLPVDRLAGLLEGALIEAVTPFPGAVAALEEIAQHYRVIVMTEGYGDIQRAIAARIGIDTQKWPLFASFDHGGRKIDGSAYAAAMAQFRFQPETTAMIGDNWDWDVVAAAAKGLSQIWISHDRGMPAAPPPRFLGAAGAFRGAKPLLDSASQ